MLIIKVLGSGCENCKKVAELARQAAAQLGVEAQVIKVTEHSEIMQYKVLATPGLVVNEKLVSAGRIPSEAEITTWIVNALETA
jgi:small redox-active disulfide protein 2